MKPSMIGTLVWAMAWSTPGSVLADDEFKGIVEKRPEGKAGTWLIAGREVVVTEKTKLEEDDGPLMPGVCAEVEYEGSGVKEIESEEPSECGESRAPAPGQPPVPK
jgi:hypothetical protein